MGLGAGLRPCRAHDIVSTVETVMAIMLQYKIEEIANYKTLKLRTRKMQSEAGADTMVRLLHIMHKPFSFIINGQTLFAIVCACLCEWVCVCGRPSEHCAKCHISVRCVWIAYKFVCRLVVFGFSVNSLPGNMTHACMPNATCRMHVGQLKLLTMQLPMSHTLPSARCFHRFVHAKYERQSKCIVVIWPCVFSFHFNLTILTIGLPFSSSWICIQWTMCQFSMQSTSKLPKFFNRKIYCLCFGHRSLTNQEMRTIIHRIFRLSSSGQYFLTPMRPKCPETN